MSDDDDWGDGGVNDNVGGGGDGSGDDWGDGGVGDDNWAGGDDDIDPFSLDNAMSSGGLGGGGSSSGGEDFTALFENTYYEADDAASAGNLDVALELFHKVLELEQEHPEVSDAPGSEPYGFLSARACIEILALTGRADDAVAMFMRLLGYLTGRRITIAKFEDTFYALVEKLSRFARLPELQEATLQAFADANQELPRIRVLLRVARQLFAAQSWHQLAPKLAELRHCCVQQNLGQQLIEVLALEMQMHDHHGRQAAVKDIWLRYFSRDRDSSSIVSPEVRAVVDFLGGKSLMLDCLYADAAMAFYRAMTHYDDVGNQSGAERALAYRLFAEMLKPKDPRKKDVDPFAEARTKIYLNRDSIVVFSNAYQAFHRQDIAALAAIVDAEPVVAHDAFLRGFRDELFTNLRLFMIARLCPCYAQIRIAFVADELHTSPDQAERLIALCIEQGQLAGKIDQVNGVYRSTPPQQRASVHATIQNWAAALAPLSKGWKPAHLVSHAKYQRA